MTKRIISTILLLVLIFSSFGGITNAMTQSDLRAVLEGRPYYDSVDSCDIANTDVTSLDNGTKEENMKAVWQYLMGKGLTAEQTAGIMGNLQSESAGTWDPRIVEFAYSDPPHLSDTIPPDVNEYGQPGYGLVQWTAGRKDGLQKFADKQGKPVNSLQLQVDFLWEELHANRKKAFEELQKATTVAEASKAIVVYYEAPQGFKTETLQNARASNGEKIYKQFVGSDSPTTSAASSTTSTDKTSSCNTTRSTSTKSTSFIYYTQDGPEYSRITIPGSTTIEYSGCGITSFAMAVANLTNPSVTPKTIVDKLTDYPDVARGEWLVNKFGSDYGLSGNHLNNTDEVVSALQRGNYVISGGTISNDNPAESPYTKKGHIVLFTGIDSDGKIMVANPLKNWGSDRSYTTSQISAGMRYAMEIIKN